MEILSDPIIFKIGIVFTALFSSIPITFFILGKSKKIPFWKAFSVSVLHSFGVLFFLVFFLNDKAGYSENNLLASVIINNSRERQGVGHRGYQYTNDNFILINTSRSNFLIPDLQNPDEGNSTVITNRQKLATLLNTINRNAENADLVVCDLTFNDASKDDSKLRDQILQLAAADKILLAEGDLKNCPQLQFGASTMADATEEIQQGKIAFYHLFKNEKAGIPYAMYQKLHEVSHKPLFLGIGTEKAAHKNALVYDGFIPRIDFNTENTGYASANGDLSDAMDFPGILELGLTATPDGQLYLANILAHRKSNHKRNIIFIGEFSNTHNADIHSTIRGDLQGATILINLFYELEQHNHYITLPPLIFLLAVFAGITYLIVRKVFKTKGSRNEHTKYRVAFMPIRVLFHIISSDWHLIAFTLIIAIVEIYYIRPVNAMPLILYFIVYESILKYIRDTESK